MRKKILQYEPSFDQNEITAIVNYMKSGGWITEFKKTKELEEKIANYLKVKHCIMVNNGTISLSLALLAMGIKPGDKVLIPSLTMIATANAVKFIGAIPIFADVEKETLCLDFYKSMPEGIKGIVYVSLNGRGSYTKGFIKYCKDEEIALIHDSAQSFGSITFQAPINSYSFSVPKIITMGQGGCLTTNDDELALKIRRLKDFGRDSGGNDIHNYFGINSKITDLQAVIGLEQLKKIDYRVKRKKEMYNLYYEQLKNIKKIEFIPTNLEYVTPWFIDIYTDKVNELVNYLKDNGIGTRKIYPCIYSQKCYNLNLCHPVAEHYSSRGLWLPSSFTLTDDEIIHVCNKIKEFFK